MSFSRLLADLLLTDIIRLKSSEGFHSNIKHVPACFGRLHFWIEFLLVPWRDKAGERYKEGEVGRKRSWDRNHEGGII